MEAKKRRKYLLALWVLHKIRRNKLKSRSVWVKPWLGRREELGAYDTLISELREEDEGSFLNFMRCSPEMFNYLLDLVSPHIEYKDTTFRRAIPAATRLAITLRYLATGDTFRSLSYLFRVAPNTIGLIVPETCEALYIELKDSYFKCPQTAEEWKDIAEGYWRRWNFPNCIGSLDGKHITLRQPACSGSIYFNYKHSFSIVLMALVDSDYKFLFCDVGSQGRISDGGVFAETALRKGIDDNCIGIPDPAPYRGETTPQPYCIIANEAFPLRSYLLKPYPQRNLTHKQRIYNYRLSRARRCVENAFGILANRFRVLLHPICLNPSKAKAIVLASCSLHNLLRTLQPASYLNGIETEDPTTHALIAGQWREHRLLASAKTASRRTASTAGRQLRDHLCDYFQTDIGSVNWQDNMV